MAPPSTSRSLSSTPNPITSPFPAPFSHSPRPFLAHLPPLASYFHICPARLNFNSQSRPTTCSSRLSFEFDQALQLGTMAQIAASMATGQSLVRQTGFFGTVVPLPPRRMKVRSFGKCVQAVSDQEEEESWVGKVSGFVKPTVAVMLSLLVLESSPDMAALAASGGRVGGRVGGGSKSYSAPPSRSYSGPSPRQYIAPSPRFSYAVPYAAPSPFFGGGVYAAPAYGVGLGAGGVFFLLVVGFIILQAFYGFLSERSGLRGSSLLSGSQPVSVLQLQVGLLGMGRTLQRDLDKIAGEADTTTAEGLHNVLTETCLALMRHPDYCISGVTSNDINRSVSAAEERFNNLSLEERGKFDEETLVNVNNLMKRMQMGARRAERFNNEYIVVTILVAAEGEYKLPQVNGNSDLKAALRKLGSIPADSIQAVEVLWTPQDENDTLSERELLRDYPLLRSL